MLPATLVTNIKTCVPIELDEDGTNFNTWVTLFKLHCRAYLVDAHIVPDDFSKTSIIKDSDCLALLPSIVPSDDCALDAWNRVENNFQNNKTSHILHLESQFNEISLSNFKSYCNEPQNLALTLNNLGTSISDNRLALPVLHCLYFDYRTFRSLVQHTSPVPSFDTLRSMLELEEHSNNKEVSSSHDSALVVTPKPSPLENSKNYDSHGPSNPRGFDRNHRRGGRNSCCYHHSPSHQSGYTSPRHRSP
ncbi:uncharacterized protein LOC130823181 [Amaranthus tricolor]|uniref:uncharacterized protein LOC130823181 n=1 Tax=Amaranthus tricolor TaxID=29722 RepID=UPI002590F29D|nr:uncharacterized protein LOC130823181 [Amaranthus tricolor]